MNDAPHPSMQRLFAATKMQASELARALNTSPQTITNWSTRGVSKQGALQAGQIFGLDSNYILHGDAPQKQPALIEATSSSDIASTTEDTMLDTNLFVPEQRHVAALDEERPPTATHIRIMRYDAIASAGSGNADWVIRENDDDPLYFRKNWFKARFLDPDNLRAMYVRGDSMEPYLYNHDTIIVDASDTEILDGDVYAIMYRKRRYVKELRNHVDGVSIISRNEKYAPMLVKFEDMKNEQDFCVLGKVVWRGG